MKLEEIVSQSSSMRVEIGVPLTGSSSPRYDHPHTLHVPAGALLRSTVLELAEFTQSRIMSFSSVMIYQ